jgi:hypothetical protein
MRQDLRNAYKITIVVIVVSILIGSVLGLLVKSDQPSNQVFSLNADIKHTAIPTGCPGIPQNSSNWLEILVVGNRTGINFVQTTVFGGSQIRIDLPLNQSAFAYYHEFNSTFEKIDVSLPAYFNTGEALDVSVNYYISGYPITTFDIPYQIPIKLSTFAC